ncbi:MAG: FHA domain-containing protein [Nostoc sp.]|uniref:FHA domain-containing protein n=1 Tax=Nostoc sp. TaxID=1180 RepID=UPI002FFD5000
MNQLTLQWAITFQWSETGNLRTQQISKQQVKSNNHNGLIIIGRDPNPKVCDLVLNDRSVSSQHVKIYFQEQQQKFFIQSLSPQNISNIDGKNLDLGKELPLQNNSNIVLGTQSLKVIDIQIYQLESTAYSGIAHSNTNSSQVGQNSNLHQVNSVPNLRQVSPSQNSGQAIPFSSIINPNQTNSSTNINRKKEHTWQDKTIIAAIVAATATILATGVTALVTYYTNQQTQETEEKKAELENNTEIQKSNIETLTKKQEKAEDRFYAHKAEILKLQRENKGNYEQLVIKNNCDKIIKIAINYNALNDVEQTQGWLIIPSNDKTSIPHNITKFESIFLHAISNDNNYQWQGGSYREKYTPISGHFNYIADDITLFYPDKEQRELSKFYEVKYDKDNSITTKTFTCNGESLKLN